MLVYFSSSCVVVVVVVVVADACFGNTFKANPRTYIDSYYYYNWKSWECSFLFYFVCFCFYVFSKYIFDIWLLLLLLLLLMPKRSERAIAISFSILSYPSLSLLHLYIEECSSWLVCRKADLVESSGVEMTFAHRNQYIHEHAHSHSLIIDFPPALLLFLLFLFLEIAISSIYYTYLYLCVHALSFHFILFHFRFCIHRQQQHKRL